MWYEYDVWGNWVDGYSINKVNRKPISVFIIGDDALENDEARKKKHFEMTLKENYNFRKEFIEFEFDCGYDAADHDIYYCDQIFNSHIDDEHAVEILEGEPGYFEYKEKLSSEFVVVPFGEWKLVLTLHM